MSACQPPIVGTIGHVDSGKRSLTAAIAKVLADTAKPSLAPHPPAAGPETYPGHDPAAGLPQPDTAGGAVIDIVFDGPPSHASGRFVEVESPPGTSIGWFGEWLRRDDGYWVLRHDPRAREASIRAEATAAERESAVERMNAAYSEWWRLGNEHGERFAAWKRGGEKGPMPESRLGSLPDYLAAAIRGGGND